LVKTCMGPGKFLDIELFLNSEFLGPIVPVKSLESLWWHFGGACHKLQKGCSEAHVKALQYLKEPDEDLVGLLVVYKLGISF
jgi:hypothetical protein